MSLEPIAQKLDFERGIRLLRHNRFCRNNDGWVILRRGNDIFKFEDRLGGVLHYIEITRPPVKMVKIDGGYIIFVPQDKMGIWIGKDRWHVKLLSDVAKCKISIKEWVDYQTSEEWQTWEEIQKLKTQQEELKIEKDNLEHRKELLDDAQRKGTAIKLSFRVPQNKGYPPYTRIQNDKEERWYIYQVSAGAGLAVTEGVTYWCKPCGKAELWRGTDLKQQVLVIAEAGVDLSAKIKRLEEEIISTQFDINNAKSRLYNLHLESACPLDEDHKTNGESK